MEAVSERAGQLVTWIMEHQREIAAVERGQLVFNISGASVIPVLTVHYEQMPKGAREQVSGRQCRNPR